MLDEHEDNHELMGLYAQHAAASEHSRANHGPSLHLSPLGCSAAAASNVAPFSSPRSGARLLSPVRIGSTSPALFDSHLAPFPSSSPSHPLLLSSPNLAHHSGGAGTGLGHSAAAGGGGGSSNSGGGATMSAGFGPSPASSPNTLQLPPLSSDPMLHAGSPMLFDSPRGSAVAHLCHGHLGSSSGAPITPISWKDMQLAGLLNGSPSPLADSSPHSRWMATAQRGMIQQMFGSAHAPGAIVTEADSGAMSMMMPRESPPQSAASSPSNAQQLSSSYAQPPLLRDDSNASVSSTTSTDLAAQFSTRFQLQSSTPLSQQLGSAHSVGSDLSFSFNEDALSLGAFTIGSSSTLSSVTSSPIQRPAAAAGLVVEELVLARSRRQQNDAHRVRSWCAEESVRQEMLLSPTSKLKQHARSLSVLAQARIGSAVSAPAAAPLSDMPPLVLDARHRPPAAAKGANARRKKATGKASGFASQQQSLAAIPSLSSSVPSTRASSPVLSAAALGLIPLKRSGSGSSVTGSLKRESSNGGTTRRPSLRRVSPLVDDTVCAGSQEAGEGSAAAGSKSSTAAAILAAAAKASASAFAPLSTSALSSTAAASSSSSAAASLSASVSSSSSADLFSLEAGSGTSCFQYGGLQILWRKASAKKASHSLVPTYIYIGCASSPASLHSIPHVTVWVDGSSVRVKRAAIPNPKNAHLCNFMLGDDEQHALFQLIQHEQNKRKPDHIVNGVKLHKCAITVPKPTGGEQRIPFYYCSQKRITIEKAFATRGAARTNAVTTAKCPCAGACLIQGVNQLQYELNAFLGPIKGEAARAASGAAGSAHAAGAIDQATKTRQYDALIALLDDARRLFITHRPVLAPTQNRRGSNADSTVAASARSSTAAASAASSSRSRSRAASVKSNKRRRCSVDRYAESDSDECWEEDETPSDEEEEEAAAEEEDQMSNQ